MIFITLYHHADWDIKSSLFWVQCSSCWVNFSWTTLSIIAFYERALMHTFIDFNPKSLLQSHTTHSRQNFSLITFSRLPEYWIRKSTHLHRRSQRLQKSACVDETGLYSFHTLCVAIFLKYAVLLCACFQCLVVEKEAQEFSIRKGICS